MNIKRYKNKDKKILIRSNNEEIKGGTTMINPVLQNLQTRLQNNINKAVQIAEQNTIKNSLGQVVLSYNDEWRDINEWNNDYDKE